jgi:N-methylhydantoinase B
VIDPADPIRLAVLRYALETVAEEMHATVVRTGRSTNIKDRQDTSSAIYTADGSVVAQSEVATPVHLGTTHEVVRRLLADGQLESLEPGDGIVMNTPYPTGPGHLNDIAVVCPVHVGTELVAIVANQAHHVDVGGFAPGSMPFGVWEIYQEGLQIPPIVGFRNYRLDEGLWPLIAANIRDPEEVRGDLEAQFAANALGARRIQELAARHGLAEILTGFEAIQDYAQRMMEAAIEAVPDGVYEFSDVVEGDGISLRDYRLHVAITVAGPTLTFDFSRTAGSAVGPINCGYASVAACVYYVMKALAGEETPANAGAFRPASIVTKPGTLLHPAFPAAVCNANIVTTQRIVDVILGALAPAIPDKIGAASSGTMHLLNFGIRRGERYLMLVETFGVGQGGLPGRDGMSAVHSHMSNTRNTPVEVLETSYPITIEEYSLVESSSGPGRWRGGLGVRRAYHLLEPTTVTLSSDRSNHPPWGVNGGAPASCANNYRVLAAGRRARLRSKVSFKAKAGERIVIETPGGGGYGDPSARSRGAVERDLQEGVLSAEEAEQRYGPRG